MSDHNSIIDDSIIDDSPINETPIDESHVDDYTINETDTDENTTRCHDIYSNAHTQCNPCVPCGPVPCPTCIPCNPCTPCVPVCCVSSEPTQATLDASQFTAYYLEPFARNPTILTDRGPEIETMYTTFLADFPCNLHYVLAESFKGILYAVGRNPNVITIDIIAYQVVVLRAFALHAICKLSSIEILPLLWSNWMNAFSRAPGIKDDLETPTFLAAASISGNPSSIALQLYVADAIDTDNNFTPCCNPVCLGAPICPPCVPVYPPCVPVYPSTCSSYSYCAPSTYCKPTYNPYSSCYPCPPPCCTVKPTQVTIDAAQFQAYLMIPLAINPGIKDSLEGVEPLYESFISDFPCHLHYYLAQIFEGVLLGIANNPSFYINNPVVIPSEIAVVKAFALHAVCKTSSIKILSVLWSEYFEAIGENETLIDELRTLVYSAAASICGNPPSILSQIEAADAYDATNDFTPCLLPVCTCTCSCSYSCVCVVDGESKPTQATLDMAQFTAYYLFPFAFDDTYMISFKAELEAIYTGFLLEFPNNLHYTLAQIFEGLLYYFPRDQVLFTIELVTDELAIAKAFALRAFCRICSMKILADLWNLFWEPLDRVGTEEERDEIRTLTYSASADICGNPENITTQLAAVGAYDVSNNFTPCCETLCIQS